MNKYQKTQDQAARKILRHSGTTKQKEGYRSAYRGIKRMLRAMTATMKWMDKTKTKANVDFGNMVLNYDEPGVVKVILVTISPEGTKNTVLSIIRGE